MPKLLSLFPWVLPSLTVITSLFSSASSFAAPAQNLITLPTTTHHYGNAGFGPQSIDGNDTTAQEARDAAEQPPTFVIVTSEHRFPTPVSINSVRVYALARAEFAGFEITDQSRAVWMMTKVATEYTLDGVEWLDLAAAGNIQKTRYHDTGDYEDEDGDGDPNNEESGNFPFIEPFSDISSIVNGGFNVHLDGVQGIRVVAKSRTHGDYPSEVVSYAAIHEIAAFGVVGPRNQAPVAAADYAFSYPGGVLIDVLDNDFDSEGSPLTLVSVENATNGTAEIVEGKVRFIPSGSLKINEGSFTYTITDGEDTSTGTVTVFDPPDVGLRYAGTLHKPGASTEPVGMAAILFASEGAATGAVTRLRPRLPFKGGIGSESPAFMPARVNKTTNTPLRISAGPRDIAGNPTITFVILSPDGTERWSGIASQSPYSRSNPSPYNGRYTAAADRGASAPSPSVGGIFNLIASRLGSVVVSGKAGNGRGFRVSSIVLSGDRVPFYAALNGSLNPASISGHFDLSTAGPQHVHGAARWISPVGAEVRLPAGLDVTFPAIGAFYAQQKTAQSMLAFNPSGLADLTFTQLSPSSDIFLTRQFGLLSLISGPEPLLNLRASVGSGMFAGKLLADPLLPRRNFQGVVLQGAGLNRGIGYVLGETQIGRVTLVPQP
jgi:hypothetical protein